MVTRCQFGISLSFLSCWPDITESALGYYNIFFVPRDCLCSTDIAISKCKLWNRQVPRVYTRLGRLPEMRPRPRLVGAAIFPYDVTTYLQQPNWSAYKFWLPCPPSPSISRSMRL
ncbi:hypothetical protein V1506DRAFT_528964, partial [Lipomyces tetrasporus]